MGVSCDRGVHKARNFHSFFLKLKNLKLIAIYMIALEK